MSDKIFKMSFGKVYVCLQEKLEKKGYTLEELNEMAAWFTGYKSEEISGFIKDEKLSYGEFFNNAPKLNIYRKLIKGKICGVDIEKIEDSLMLEVRRFDKLVDERAKGKAMELILRKPVTIDDYIEVQEEKVKSCLVKAREAIREKLPKAKEVFAWDMPTWKEDKNIIHFAANKEHLGIYPGPAAIEHFSKRFEELGYKYSNGAVQFPYKKGIPYEFIGEIALWSRENQEKEKKAERGAAKPEEKSDFAENIKIPAKNREMLKDGLVAGDIILLWRVAFDTFTTETVFPKYFKFTYGIDAEAHLEKLINEGYIEIETAFASLDHINAERKKEILKGLGVAGLSKVKSRELDELLKANLTEEELGTYFSVRGCKLTEKGSRALKDNQEVVDRHPKKNM